MVEEERPEEDREPRRPRVVDRRISARKASGETVPPAPETTSQASSEPSTPAPESSTAGAEATPTGSPPPGPPPEDQGAQQAAPGQEVWTPEQEAEAQRMAEEIARTPSLDWVVQTAVTLANVAGTKLQMGAASDAQLAIDALAGVVEAAGSRLQDAEAPLRQTLAQLQLMFAERSGPPTPGQQT